MEEVIDELHESFAIDTKAMINCLETTMDEITSKDDFPRFFWPMSDLIIESGHSIGHD